MPAPDPFAPFLNPLERLAFPYCITGSVAASVYGEPRLTADTYLAASDPLHAWALENRRRVDLGGSGAWIAPPEYVILRKLEFLREGGSDKHIRDVRFILAATPVDRSFLNREVSRLGVQAEWTKTTGENEA